MVDKRPEHEAQPPLQPLPMTSCSGCALYCDDVLFEIDPTHNPRLITDCQRGQNWAIAQQRRMRTAHIQGRAASGESALAHGLSLMRRSSHPQLIGLNHLTLADQQLAINWIQQWRGSVDIDVQQIQSSHQLALSIVGRVTATIGQIADNADLVVVWGEYNEAKIPRLKQRLDMPSKTWWHFDLPATDAADLIQWWRIVVKQWKKTGVPDPLELKSQRVLEFGKSWGGQLPIVWLTTLHQIVSSGYVAWLYDLDEQQTSSAATVAFYRWVRELNDLTRAVCLPLSANHNSLGAENVLAWTTGFSRSLNFNIEPRSGQTFSARRQLESGDIDLLIAVVGEAKDCYWPTTGRHPESSIPVILLHACDHDAARQVELAIPIPQLGWDVSGDVCRLDEWVVYRPAWKANEFFWPKHIFAGLSGQPDWESRLNSV